MADNVYFAALPTNEVGSAISSRMNSYYTYGSPASQVAWKQVRAWMYAYGYGNDWFHGTSQVIRGGDQGEMAYVRMNHSRTVLNAAVAQIITPDVSWNTQAESYTSASVRATTLANNVLDHVWHNCDAKAAFSKATESAALMGEGFILQSWDRFAGRALFAMDGAPIKSGDFKFQNLWAPDVIRNPGVQSWDDLSYVFVRMRPNRWNLAAEYPAHAEAILRAPAATPDASQLWLFSILNTMGLWDRDSVGVTLFLHKQTAALPNGRIVLMLRDGTVLEDRPLGCGGMLPLRRISKAEMTGTPFAYTEYFDTLAAQEVYDNLWSADVTNLMAFATQFIAYERGTNPDIIALGGGLAMLPYDPGGKPPQGVNLTAMAPGAQQVKADLRVHMEQTMGQNAVTLGQSPGDRAPASLAALLDATSARQAGMFMQSYLKALREAGTYVLRLFQENVKPQYPYSIGLRSDAPATEAQWKRISPEDIKEIDQVYVDIGTTAQQSAAGRMQFAEMVAKAPDPDTRKALIEVYETGRIEPVTEESEEQLALVLAENEQIAAGQTPTAHPVDDHYFHAKMHSIPVLTPAARQNPAALKAHMEHLNQHYSFAFGIPLPLVGQVESQIVTPDGQIVAGPGADPNYQMNMQILLGKPVTPPGVGVPGAAGMPPPPMGTPPAPQGVGNAPVPAGARPGAGIPQANLPTNASTKQTWDPMSGGGTMTPPKT